MRLTGRSLLSAFCFSLLALAPLAAQGTGRIIGRVVDAAQGAPIAGAQVEVVDTSIRAVSALDGRYTLQGVPAGPVSVRVRMIGFGPKTVTGILVPSGQTVAQDISMTAEAVQLAEISVSAASERGTVNRALAELRYATAIVSSVTSEQIHRRPRPGRALHHHLAQRLPDPEPRAGAQGRAARPVPGEPARGHHHVEDVHAGPAG
jgi:hypothetical protein